MRVVNVVGARPNFVKIAPLMSEMARYSGITPVLVHTGQHYDGPMSDQFFTDLEIRPPDFNLGVGSGSHAVQTAEVMRRLEPILENARPDLVLVVGDVNSTLAAALTSVKLGIPVAHVEAGLRSFDRTMPEEINRILTDHLSTYMFTTELSGNQNLVSEGIAADRVFFVGNVMVDTLFRLRPVAMASTILKELDAEPQKYGLLTLHRPANVDDRETLNEILEAIVSIAKTMPVFFPCHPRTKARLEESKLDCKGVRFLQPLGYLDFLCLMSQARLVLTDSGGIQEETTALGIACLTLRENTERPVTIEKGTNVLVGTSRARILAASEKVFNGNIERKRDLPELWDGRAAERIATILQKQLTPATHEQVIQPS